MMLWTLNDALVFIRELQPRAMDAGWCILLAGGVLNRGTGPDLDVLAYPRDRAAKRKSLLALLPPGEWSTVSVADIYTFQRAGTPVELIFQTWVPE